MTAFLRRFEGDPGDDVLLDIESVNIIDEDPPAPVAGVPTGTALLVAEFEDGPFGEPVLASSSSVVRVFGRFGHAYSGVGGSNPCARARRPDGAVVPEYWNGNGFIALHGKTFRRLLIVRVDTSVGQVEFTRRAAVYGSTSTSFDLEPGQQVSLVGSSTWLATFSAAAAVKTSSAGAFPTNFLGGEAMTIALKLPGGSTRVVDVVFAAADQTQNQVIARVNAAAGFALAATGGAGVTTLTALLRGSSSSVQVTSQGSTVATALGFNTTAASGSGNVADVDNISVAEVNTILGAVDPGLRAERAPDGRLMVWHVSSASLEVGAVSPFAANLGLTVGTVGAAAAEVAGSIPAGTRVRTSGGAEWVTMQRVSVPAGTVGPYRVKVRPALDDGSGVSAGANTVTVLAAPIVGGAFTVTNPSALSPALSESAIDAAYVDAIAASARVSTEARSTNIIWAARASNMVRNALRDNAVKASAGGCLGRVCVTRPPLGTSPADARASANPGVGANRHKRNFYAYPGVRVQVPAIARVGAVAGGPGFTDDGVIDVGFDGFVASLNSVLRPEENVGQLTDYLGAVLALESNPELADLDVDAYKALRRAGITAPNFDGGKAVVQSAVTSVDPDVEPANVEANRQRMSDFIGDSLALISKPYAKTLQSRSRRGELLSQYRTFLGDLVGAERLANCSVKPTGNTPNSIARGLFRVAVKGKMLPTFLSIALTMQVGATVEVEQE